MQNIIIFIGMIAIFYLYKVYKSSGKRRIFIAGLISLIWVKFSGLYNYSDVNITYLGINMYAFIAWTTALVLLYEIYKYLKKDYKKTVIVYIIAVLVLEYVGYNYLGIQLATNYPGLLGLELMHMPWWGQLYYLTIGPLYLKLLEK